MKLFSPIAAICFALSAMLFSCEKEYSIDNNTAVIGEGTAEGVLGGDATAGCSNSAVSGAYGQGLATDSFYKALVDINFTKAGTYNISTDTINGVYFIKTGIVNTTGVTSILLDAKGTPTATGSYTYTVKFKGSACSFTIDVLAVAPSNGIDYFPVTTNSFWKYVSSDPTAAPEDTLRNISTGDIFAIVGNNYNLFSNNTALGTDSSFYSKSGGDYHQYGDMDIAGIATNVVAADFIFLKDNVPAGASWESIEGDATINSISVKIKLKFAVTEKNVNVQLGNAVFKDVIKITTAEQVQQPAGYSTILTYETWYAKGIGIINIAAAAPLYGFQLQQYQVF